MTESKGIRRTERADRARGRPRERGVFQPAHAAHNNEARANFKASYRPARVAARSKYIIPVSCAPRGSSNAAFARDGPFYALSDAPARSAPPNLLRARGEKESSQGLESRVPSKHRTGSPGIVDDTSIHSSSRYARKVTFALRAPIALCFVRPPPRDCRVRRIFDVSCIIIEHPPTVILNRKI